MAKPRATKKPDYFQMALREGVNGNYSTASAHMRRFLSKATRADQLKGHTDLGARELIRWELFSSRNPDAAERAFPTINQVSFLSGESQDLMKRYREQVGDWKANKCPDKIEGVKAIFPGDYLGSRLRTYDVAKIRALVCAEGLSVKDPATELFIARIYDDLHLNPVKPLELYRSIIEKNPHTPIAAQAFGFFAESLEIGFTGTLGIRDIPKEFEEIKKSLALLASSDAVSNPSQKPLQKD